MCSTRLRIRGDDAETVSGLRQMPGEKVETEEFLLRVRLLRGRLATNSQTLSRGRKQKTKREEEGRERTRFHD